MNFELTREDVMIKDAIRNWVSKECTRDIVSELDEKEEFPKKLFKKLSKLGFSGMIIPEKFEGEGKNILGACLVTEEIAYAYPALASCYASPTFYGGAVISELGSDKQKMDFLPGLAMGKIIVSLALSESFDSDAEYTKTTAVADGNHFVINGKKSYITLADQADLLILLAKTGEEEQNLTLFCIDAKEAGISVMPVEKMGYKGVNFCDIEFNNVQVSSETILGGTEQLGNGQQQMEQIQNLALLAIASSAIGMSRGALDYALEHARQRVQFGQPIGRFPAISRKLSETAYKIDAAKLLVHKAAWIADQGKTYSREAAMAKCFAAEAAIKAAMEGLQVLGGYGYTMEYDIQRYVRDSVALLSAGLSVDFLKERIGASLGLN